MLMGDDPEVSSGGDIGIETNEDMTTLKTHRHKLTAAAEQKLTDEVTNMTVAYFVFSLVWTVGTTIDGSSRLKFDEFFRVLCEMEAANTKYPRSSLFPISCSEISFW